MPTLRNAEKKHLSAPGLLATVRRVFEDVAEPIRSPRGKKPEISLPDCLMSGLAVFGLKFPSLLQFDQQRSQEMTQHNLQSLYRVEKAPCDTQLRERLDLVNPDSIRKTFKAVFSALQRGKVLEQYCFLGDYYLMSQDGTGVFSSEHVHCECCCEKHHKDGKITYHHQMLAGVLVHPDHREVFSLCPEAITKQDGTTKNDCERNASFRFLEHVRREHPHLKLIVTSDALNSNGPYIRKLQLLDMRYIIVVKPDGNKSLFEWLKGVKFSEHEVKLEDGSVYTFRFINDIPLNDTHHDIKVNYFEVDIQGDNGKLQHFSWITDVQITKENVYDLCRGGRAKWKIENETFNTLKNQGYNFEHNFGHGYKNLSTVLTLLMFLAFLIDQVQQRCCGLFQAAVKKVGTRVRLWFKIRALWEHYYINSWEDLYQSLALGLKGAHLEPNSS